jgi:hypothetical protein
MAVAAKFDELLKLQIDELQKFLSQEKVAGATDPSRMKDLAEHICEWTRTILSRSFGRIGDNESEVLAAVFEQSSETIRNFATVATVDVDREILTTYADHVKNRIRHLPNRRRFSSSHSQTGFGE